MKLSASRLGLSKNSGALTLCLGQALQSNAVRFAQRILCLFFELFHQLLFALDFTLRFLLTLSLILFVFLYLHGQRV